MGLFNSVKGFLHKPLGFLETDSLDLLGASKAAFLREQERLKALKQEARKEAAFALTEGQGIAERAEVTLGDELDLELLTPEEREARSTGRITTNTGLIL